MVGWFLWVFLRITLPLSASEQVLVQMENMTSWCDQSHPSPYSFTFTLNSLSLSCVELHALCLLQNSVSERLYANRTASNGAMHIVRVSSAHIHAHFHTGFHLQNRSSKVKLLRISRQQGQNIKPRMGRPQPSPV